MEDTAAETRLDSLEADYDRMIEKLEVNNAAADAANPNIAYETVYVYDTTPGSDPIPFLDQYEWDLYQGGR